VSQGHFLFFQYPKAVIHGGGGVSMNPDTQNAYDWEDGPTEAFAVFFFPFCCVTSIFFGLSCPSQVGLKFLVTD
jgi:hypothetical protein